MLNPLIIAQIRDEAEWSAVLGAATDIHLNIKIETPTPKELYSKENRIFRFKAGSHPPAAPREPAPATAAGAAQQYTVYESRIGATGQPEIGPPLTGSSDCSVEPVSRKCCGPNATLATEGSTWCACNPGFGCGAGTPACQMMKACSSQAAFHINVPRRCLEGAPQQSLLRTKPMPGSRQQCITQNNTIRFIHIDKTGGTSIRKWFDDAFPEQQWQNKLEYPGGMGHLFTLGTGCAEDCYAFFVRDPVRRWVSRFLHRKRQAEQEPERYGITAWGKVLQHIFPTPTSLAEALSSPNATHQKFAEKMFRSEIGANKRLGRHYLNMLLHQESQQSILNRIVYVGGTTSLNEDFASYAKLVGLPVERLGGGSKGGDLEVHNVKPKSQDSLAQLSELAKRNAEAALEEDYEVLQILHDAGLITETCKGTDDCNL